MPDKIWTVFVQKLLTMFTATVCVVVVLLVTANDPSADEVARGVPAGILAYLGAHLFRGKST